MRVVACEHDLEGVELRCKESEVVDDLMGVEMVHGEGERFDRQLVVGERAQELKRWRVAAVR